MTAWKDKTPEQILEDMNKVVQILSRPATLPPDLFHPKYGWLWRNGKPNKAACKKFDDDLKDALKDIK